VDEVFARQTEAAILDAMLRRSPLFAMLAVACGESTPRVEATNEAPADDRLAGIVEIQAFDGAVCARDGAGDVYCWGDQYGAAGLEGPAGLGNSERPRKIRGAHDIVRLGTHENAFGYATAVRADGEIVVWPHVELRPRIEFVIKPEEKISDDDWVRINERTEDRRVADPDPWHARATGLRVEAIDLFADTGCFYTAGLLSCAGLPKGIDLPRYDGLQWRYEPGIVDIAAVRDPYEADPEACVLYADGKLECERNGARHVVEVPARVKTIMGGGHVVVLLEDGRVGRIEGGRTLVFDDGVGGIVELGMSGTGHRCGQDADGAVTCWGPDGHRRARITGIERAQQVSQEHLTACVLEVDGHVACASRESYQRNCDRFGKCDPLIELHPVPAPTEERAQ
jgi:hypothetical protein